jgi:hypothetical protein
MFIENLNDTMHPMIVHRGVVDAANDYIKTLPEGSAHRDEAEIIPPFGASYTNFEETGKTGFPRGHHYDGGKRSIHANYSVDPGYEAMIKAYGGTTREILTFNIAQHLTTPFTDHQVGRPEHPHRAAPCGGQVHRRDLVVPAQGCSGFTVAAHHLVLAPDQLQWLDGGAG